MKKIIIIGVVALVLIVGGILAFVFVFNSDDSGEEKQAIYFEYAIEEQYSNIVDEGKIVKFEVVIEYTDETLQPKLKKNNSKIINNMLEILRAEKYEVLSKPNGQKRVREKFRAMLIELLEADEESITNVYFTQFIIQG